MFLSGGTPDDGGTVTSGPVSIDGFSLGVRWLVLVLGGILALVQSGDTFRTATSRPGTALRWGTCEEAGTFLLLLAGLSLVGVANDLVLLFAGLELVSIPTYILLALKRTDARGQEARALHVGRIDAPRGALGREDRDRMRFERHDDRVGVDGPRPLDHAGQKRRVAAVNAVKVADGDNRATVVPEGGSLHRAAQGTRPAAWRQRDASPRPDVIGAARHETIVWRH
jgi:hypothetical protein